MQGRAADHNMSRLGSINSLRIALQVCRTHHQTAGKHWCHVHGTGNAHTDPVHAAIREVCFHLFDAMPLRCRCPASAQLPRPGVAASDRKTLSQCSASVMTTQVNGDRVPSHPAHWPGHLAWWAKPTNCQHHPVPFSLCWVA